MSELIGLILIFLVGYPLPSFCWGYAVARWYRGRAKVLVLLFGAVTVALFFPAVVFFLVNFASDIAAGRANIVMAVPSAFSLSLYVLGNLVMVILPAVAASIMFGYAVGDNVSHSRVGIN